MKRLAMVLLLAACTDKPNAPGQATVGGKPAAGFGEVQLPAGFPPAFPIYPGARLVGSARTEVKGKRVLAATFQTPDALDEVSQFYASSRFAEYNINGGAKTPESPLWLSDPKKKLDLRLSLAADESGTSIQIKLTPF